jgi:hypothetical protein
MNSVIIQATKLVEFNTIENTQAWVFFDRIAASHFSCRRVLQITSGNM